MRFRTAAALSAISACLALTPAAQAQPDRGDRFTAQAPAVEQPGRREWIWQGGNGLNYAGSGHLRYQPGGPPRIIVTGDPDEVANIEVDGGVIRPRNSRGFNFRRRDSKLDILVQGVTLDKFDLAGSGAMELGRLVRDALDLQLHGSGAVNARGQAKHLKLELDGSGRINLDQMSAGAGDITVNGSGDITMGAIAEGANIRVAGSGRVKIGDVGKNTEIRAVGSGDVSVGRVEDVNVTLMGSASVRFSSPPQHAAYRVMGSGRVVMVGPDGKTTDLARMNFLDRPPHRRDTDPRDRN